MDCGLFCWRSLTLSGIRCQLTAKAAVHAVPQGIRSREFVFLHCAFGSAACGRPRADPEPSRLATGHTQATWKWWRLAERQLARQNENGRAEPASGANGGGRTPCAQPCTFSRRHRSLLSFGFRIQ